ncbi:MAG: metal-dependent hydrolase [Desulfovibrionaceae bacterium]|nr:metal-dependent hydrolase [Desulfovibrionaceae bacterium]
MDPLTHLSSGLLAAQAVRGRFPASRALLPLCLVGAWIPDMDNFFGSGDPERYLLWHRGLTHSLAGGLVLAGLLALLGRALTKKLPLGRTFALAYALILAHIFLDLITSYGTQILAPFSNARLSLDCVFIVDPFFTLTLLGFAVAAAWRRDRGRTIAAAGLVWMLAYPAANLGLKAGLEHLYAAQLKAHAVRFERLDFTPDAFTPYFWKAVIDQGGRYSATTVCALDLDREYKRVAFDKADRALMRRLGREASIFKTYEWFSVYPVQSRERLDGEEFLQFGDLRFTITNPVMLKLFGNRRPPFTLTAVIDASGRLLEHRFQWGRKPRVQTVVE